MSGTILTHEPAIRLVAFASVFVALAAWEIFAPRRGQKLTRRLRWTSNMGVVILDTVLVRLVFPTTVVAIALGCEAQGWGLFQVIRLPAWATIPLAVIAMDLAIYL